MKTGDILIVAGKGHEKIQEYKKIKKLFSDQQQILKNITIKNKTLSSNLKLNILKELSNSNNISSKLKLIMHQLILKKLKKIIFSLQLRVKIKMVIYLLKKPLLREHL